MSAGFRLNGRGRITAWSPGACRLFGWSAEEAVGRSARRLLQAEPLAWARARRRVRREERWQGELALTTRQGAQLQVQARWRRRDEEIAGVFRDVTLQRLAAAQLDRLGRLESLAQVVNGLAHDLNNVLAPILMSAGLMKMILPEAERDLAGVVETSGERGAALIREIQHFARALPADGMPTPPEVVVSQIVRLCRNRFPAGILVTVNANPEAPPILVDPIRLHQLLWELCRTARQALGETGTLALELRGDGSDMLIETSAHHVTALPAGPDRTGPAVAAQGGHAEPWRLAEGRLTRRLRWPARPEPAPPLPRQGAGQVVAVTAEEPLKGLLERVLRAGGYRTEGPPDAVVDPRPLGPSYSAVQFLQLVSEVLP